MKRDWDLIRKMILAAEDSPTGYVPSLRFEGHSDAEVAYHAYLLIDAGFARGFDATTNDSEGPEAVITSLTWAGHEFADAARDGSRWASVMNQVQKGGGAITVAVLTQLLVGLMKQAFGLA